MSNLKIAGVALVAILGATSIASAATRYDQNAHRNDRVSADRSLDNAPLQEGRSVYVAPSYQQQTPEPVTQFDGSNAPAH